MSAEEIKLLREYEYTVPDTSTSYERFKANSSAEKLERYYGVNRDSLSEFANAREFLYREPRWATSGGLTYDFKAVNDFEGSTYTADEVIAEIAYSSDTLTITVKAGTSCVYRPDTMTGRQLRFARLLLWKRWMLEILHTKKLSVFATWESMRFLLPEL